MIVLEQVSKKFKQNKKSVTALSDISLEIQKNDFFGLVGVSGSGKSTLLRLINGLENPSQGKITINQKELQLKASKERRELIQQMAMIFQQFNLLQNLTVQQNMELALKIHRKKATTIVFDMLDFVGMLEHKDKYPSQLSGGQKQRVAIARALTTQPSILLCDEPTSALDQTNGQEIMKLLKKTQLELGTTIVFVSHELDIIKKWCNKAAIMENGQILSVIDVKKPTIVETEQSYYEKALGYLG